MVLDRLSKSHVIALGIGMIVLFSSFLLMNPSPTNKLLVAIAVFVYSAFVIKHAYTTSRRAENTLAVSARLNRDISRSHAERVELIYERQSQRPTARRSISTGMV